MGLLQLPHHLPGQGWGSGRGWGVPTFSLEEKPRPQTRVQMSIATEGNHPNLHQWATHKQVHPRSLMLLSNGKETLEL